MKYGIKHDNGRIIALSEFGNDIVPVAFVEITQTKYEGFIIKMAANPFYIFNESTLEIEQSVSDLVDAQNTSLKSKKRLKLLELSNELDLQTRLGESTTATQDEFDDLKAEYVALGSPPP